MALRRVLGPIELVFYSVGVIVGAGVYSVIGSAAGLAQQHLWSSFAIGAVVALLTALSYAEMATAYPQAGAEYIYVRRAWPKADWLAFGVGVTILIGGAAASATVAMSFGGYLRSFLDVPLIASALALVVGCTMLNVWGMRESSIANMTFTAVEVGGLLLVIGAWLATERQPVAAPAGASPAVMAAAALLFFVYLGFEEVANMAEEVRRPGRDLPLALFVSLAITTLLYILVSLAVVSLVPPAELASSEAPLAVALEAAWPRLGGVLSAIALFATANTVLVTMIAASRLAYSMARHGEIHGRFATLLPRRDTPWAAGLLVLAMTVVLLPISDVKILAEMSSFAALLAFFTVNLALIALRYREPSHPRPFRVPGAIGRLPIVPVLAIASVVVLLVNFEWQIYVSGAVALVLTALVYAARQYRRRRGP